MSQTPVVYVVDDDPSVSRALARLFRVAGLRLVSFATAQEFLSHPNCESPSCLVLDVQLPDLNGLDLQRELKERDWRLPIVFITGHGNVPMAVEAMRAGAVHFLPKPCDNRELLAAIRQALDRDREHRAQQKEAQRIKPLIDALTPREREVFLLVAAGLANKNIASRLRISLQTVKLHRGNVMQKLQLDSIADLVHFAQKTRAILPDLEFPT
ncbi:MAG TPA: response regulator [Gemmataceae bacterium]|nr:response regulator [Gemmataceae bacterium]